jgi:hypothetical protein
MNFDKHLDARANQAEARAARHYDMMCKREEIAEQQIGELSNGKYYVFPVGGKYKESNSRVDLISYLIRNKYA